MIRRNPVPLRSSRIEPLENRLLLHAGHDHADVAPAPSEPAGAPAAEIVPAAVGDPLLPDLFPLASQSKGYVYGWTYDTTTVPGRTLLRLTTAVANQGRGAMELRGGTINQDGTQNVNQRVYKEGGGYTDRLAGTFTYHAAHQHIHFDDFASYKLREITAGDGIGAPVATGQKVSFCLLDIDRFNGSLPGSPASSRFNSCGQVQGISVGWADVYDKTLPDQWIDVTEAPNGRYWLEVAADPENALQESDETNNFFHLQMDLAKPTSHPTVASHAPSGQFPGQASFVEFVFSQPMNTLSFSVADDVASFTGPGGADLRGQITGSTWVNNRTLRVTFPTQTAPGAYSMRIGPDIRGIGTGTQLDQDLDNRPGEATQDQYVASFTLVSHLGPDGFGYEARQTPFEPIDLVRGGPGVVVLLDGADDNAASINLAANTFNFYGTTYTGAATLFASTNGLISFGGAETEYDNGDLGEDPTVPTIAPLWDDWRTNVDAADVLLYSFQNVTGDAQPDRLVIEWSSVRPFSSDVPSPTPVTFQAILQLNTGTIPGTIVFNYPDLNSGDPDSTNGAGATVGIKAAGFQGFNRLVVSQDRSDHPFVATGRAVRIERRPVTVVGRHLFYNRSAFDGRSAAMNSLDDGAVATDKAALLPGQAATLANVSTYARGINGVMVDLAGLGNRTLTLADFTFRATAAGGKGAPPSAPSWGAAPPPTSIQVRRGAGAGGSDRVALVWSDKAIRNQWLEVTVNATPNTLLSAPDVFYFGSLIGETGSGLSPFQVSPADLKQTRHALRTRVAAITSPADHNRDGRVDVRDVSLVRANLLRSIPALGTGAAGATTASASATTAPLLPQQVGAEEESVADSVLS